MGTHGAYCAGALLEYLCLECNVSTQRRKRISILNIMHALQLTATCSRPAKVPKARMVLFCMASHIKEQPSKIPQKHRKYFITRYFMHATSSFNVDSRNHHRHIYAIRAITLKSHIRIGMKMMRNSMPAKTAHARKNLTGSLLQGGPEPVGLLVFNSRQLHTPYKIEAISSLTRRIYIFGR